MSKDQEETMDEMVRMSLLGKGTKLGVVGENSCLVGIKQETFIVESIHFINDGNVLWLDDHLVYALADKQLAINALGKKINAVADLTHNGKV